MAKKCRWLFGLFVLLASSATSEATPITITLEATVLPDQFHEYFKNDIFTATVTFDYTNTAPGDNFEQYDLTWWEVLVTSPTGDVVRSSANGTEGTITFDSNLLGDYLYIDPRTDNFSQWWRLNSRDSSGTAFNLQDPDSPFVSGLTLANFDQFGPQPNCPSYSDPGCWLETRGSTPGDTGALVPTGIGVEVDGATVPEPASLSLLGLGLAAIAVRRWRQRT